MQVRCVLLRCLFNYSVVASGINAAHCIFHMLIVTCSDHVVCSGVFILHGKQQMPYMLDFNEYLGTILA